MGLRRRLTHSLSAKISAAFVVVLALHASIAILAHFGLDKAQEDTARLDQGRKLALRMIAIDRSVGSLQRDVLAFTYTGHRSVLDRVNRTMSAVVEDLELARDQVAQAAEREEIEAMLAAVARYRDQFALAVIDRQLRKKIVEERMPSLSERAAKIFRALLASQRGSDTPRGIALVALVQQHFNAAESGARHYVHDLDSSAVRSANEMLGVCRADLASLGSMGGEGVAAAVATAEELLRDYDSMLIRLVQTTRGYLHLVNVVMAGEAAEFLRSSSRLREGHMAELDHLSATIRRDQRNFQVTSAIISAVTILIGLFASTAITKVVVQPLRRITQTLSRLARGEEASIPERDRKDDIGAMAKAAEVFRERNRETVRMLAELRALAESHEATIADLENTNRELDSFAHIASHDLKAPLRAMGLLAAWIEEDAGESLSPESRDHLETLQRRVVRMTRLLDDLLAYAKAGRANAELDRVEVVQCAREAAHLAGIPESFSVSIDGDPAWVEAPPVALQQVLQNLISNGVKHHDREAGSIEVTVSEDGEDVVVAVSDDGPGIPREHQDRIFAPFETLKSRDELDASGVGLALVKKILDRYGGSIAVSSEPGAGATFRLKWPRAHAEGDPRPRPRPTTGRRRGLIHV